METSQNISNFPNFSKHQTRPSALTTDPNVYEHSPDNISSMLCSFRSSELKDIQKKKYPTIKITMLYDSIHKLLQNFIHKKCVYCQSSFMKGPKFSLSPNLKLVFIICHLMKYHRYDIFCFFFSLPPSLFHDS